MPENRSIYSMQASGAPAAAEPAGVPAREDYHRVDDHLVEPEITRDQVIGGQTVKKMPAERPHATKHSRLDYVLSAKVVPGYCTASDLITRVDVESDFASDAAILKDGTDPDTGSRYLEELAFEIVSTQSKKDVTDKAVRMHRRGVRRIFAIFVTREQVCEWSSGKRAWEPLDAASAIDDPCLIEPLEVVALLDAAAADNAVASALITKGNPVIEQLGVEREAKGEARGIAKGEASGIAEGEARGLAKGKAEGKAEAILDVLDARGLDVHQTDRERILLCSDLDVLQRWLRRATTATSVAELFQDP